MKLIHPTKFKVNNRFTLDNTREVFFDKEHGDLIDFNTLETLVFSDGYDDIHKEVMRRMIAIQNRRRIGGTVSSGG